MEETFFLLSVLQASFLKKFHLGSSFKKLIFRGSEYCCHVSKHPNVTLRLRRRPEGLALIDVNYHYSSWDGVQAGQVCLHSDDRPVHSNLEPKQPGWQPTVQTPQRLIFPLAPKQEEEGGSRLCFITMVQIT